MTVAVDAALCALILIAALASVAGRGLFRALAFFIVYGLLLALAWVRLGAVDVALAEAAIGAGLTGVLLLAAHGRLARVDAHRQASDQPRPLEQYAIELSQVDRLKHPENKRIERLCAPRMARSALAALAGLSLAGLLIWAWSELPLPQSPAPEIAGALPRAGVTNPVTAVLLNFRAWDTLLESIVLVSALIALWSLAATAAWPKRPGVRQYARNGGVLYGFGRVLPPIAALVGIYLVYAGAKQPGGAFQGGTILAAAALVAILGAARRPPRVGSISLRAALAVGPATFVAIGLVGAVLGVGFLTLPEPYAGGIILAIEIMLAASIAVTLALLVLGPPEAAGEE